MIWLLYVMLGALILLVVSALGLVIAAGVKLAVWARKRSAASALPAAKSPRKRARRKSLK